MYLNEKKEYLTLQSFSKLFLLELSSLNTEATILNILVSP